MSAGLRRAREPYRVKNMLVGGGLAAFAVGIWAYSISAVKQDVFDDVDEEAKALAATRTTTASAPTPTTSAVVAAPAATLTTAPIQTVAVTKDPVLIVASKEPPTLARGILPRLFAQRYPSLFDPQHQTVVWGAPSVDNVGKLSSSKSS